MTMSGLSSLGVPGMQWHPQILADQLPYLNLGAVYAHHILAPLPGFSYRLEPCLFGKLHRSGTLQLVQCRGAKIGKAPKILGTLL